MRITVRVKTNARKNVVEAVDATTLLVHVTAPPVEGRANERIIELLSEYLRKPKRSISIVRGLKSKEKIIEID